MFKQVALTWIWFYCVLFLFIFCLHFLHIKYLLAKEKTLVLHHLTLWNLFCVTVKSHNALVKHLKLMTNPEDFELKKLLYNIMVTMGNDSTALPVRIVGVVTFYQRQSISVLTILCHAMMCMMIKS